MTTNTDKLAAHMALRERAFSLAESQDSIADVRLAGAPTFVSTHSGNLARNTANTLRELAQALEAAGRVQQAEPVAVLRFQRDTPGHENDMPAVVSCNWLPDGDYRVYLATPAERAPAPTVAEPVMTYLGRHTMDCGEHGSHNMEMHKLIPAGTKLYDHAASTAQEASKPVQAEAPCQGDPGECAFNKACMYRCGRLDPPVQAEAAEWSPPSFRDRWVAASESYRGPRCMCLQTGCRAGPGCPHYSVNCREHINHATTQPPAIPAAPAVQASGEREEGARIWIDQSETTSLQIVGKLLRSIPDEYLVTAERDNEDDDWYIRVTNSGGYKDYDGYWRSSARKTADEVMLEAARGAMVPLAALESPPASGEKP